ncbi:MAG: hypothetical protein AB7S54_00175 [Bacteroidales bacterium]
MIKDISGRWLFSEEFECGTDRGFAVLNQNGNLITGYLEYEECVEDEESFWVRQEVSGSIEGSKVKLEGIKAISPSGEELAGYNLDMLEGTYTHEEKIVGHSYDCDDICGVFVMNRY